MWWATKALTAHATQVIRDVQRKPLKVTSIGIILCRLVIRLATPGYRNWSETCQLCSAHCQRFGGIGSRHILSEAQKERDPRVLTERTIYPFADRGSRGIGFRNASCRMDDPLVVPSSSFIDISKYGRARVLGMSGSTTGLLDAMRSPTQSNISH